MVALLLSEGLFVPLNSQEIIHNPDKDHDIIMSSAAFAVEETTYTSDNTKRKRRRRRSNAARRRQQRQRQRRSRPRLSLHRAQTSQRDEKYDEYYESSLRERWVDVILSSSSIQTTTANNAIVRPLNRDEWRYLYETEMLVDKLLGWHDDDDDDDEHVHNDVSSLCEEYNRQNNNDKTTTVHRLSVSNRGSELFVTNAMIISIVTVSSVMVVLVRKLFVSTRIIQDMVSSISTFITVQQSSNIIPSSISAMQTTLRGYALHIQALWGSRSYLLRHFDRIRLVPLLLRLLRKCIILEAWRHVWVMTYKVTIKIHKSVTVQNVKLLYTKVCPGWIRRGLRNMCQGMIQSHITGAVGGLIVMGGGGGGGSTTIDSIIWPSSSVSGDGGGNGDGSSSSSSSSSSSIDDIITAASTTTNMLEDSSSSVVDECVNAIQQSVSEVIDSVAEEVLAESTI